jgi:hypothetical protein
MNMKRFAIMTILLLTVSTWTQAQVRQNVLDASPQVGTGGYNQPARTFQPAPGFGNLYITGNVTGGKQFQGFVPYSDPTQFQGRLGSSALSSFERVAPNINRVELGEVGGKTLPFYFRSSTILPLTAIEKNYNMPGSSLPRSQILPQSPSYLSGATLTESYNQSLRKELPPAIRPTDILIPDVAMPELQPGEDVYTRPLEAPTEMLKELKPIETVEKSEELEEAPAERSPLMQPIMPEDLKPDQRAKEDFTGWLTRQAEQMEETQILVGPQQEYAESANRLAVQGKEVKGAPGTTTQPTPKPATQPAKPSARADVPVVTSLTGTGRDPFTLTMRSAQKLMNQSQFYDAYYKYAEAQSLKADDPLPLFGQANALLAAGDLRSAANHLRTALERFPKFLYLKLDGSHLLGSKSILDRRREQVQNLMTKDDDPNLTLLAGYLELLTGNRDKGFELINKSGLL